mgnify:FL=1
MEKEFSKIPYSIQLSARLFAIILILAIVYYSQSILLPILFAAIISISLFPLAQLLERLRIGKAASALLAVTVAITIISAVKI